MNGGSGHPIEFRVLGPLEVVAGGRTVALGSPKQRALLAVLVMSANHVVAVDRIVDEVWGDEAPARAMASLQAYVSRLRRLLQPSGANRGRSDVLVTQAPGYLLRVEPASIDAVRFEVTAAAAVQLMSAGDPHGALREFDAAMALWRGPPYADFGYEEFAQREIARLAELRLSVVDARIAALLASGQHGAAVADAEAVVREHPLREATWAALITGLYRTGRQGEALRAYRRASQVIGEELGLEPSPALKALEDGILRHAPDLDAPPLASMSPPLAAPQPARMSPQPGDVPQEALVGRTAELEAIGAALATVVQGSGRTVLLCGEPGIGKSRLAREAARRAGAAGALVGGGGCVDGPVTAAYWPWTHALRELIDGFGDAALPVPVRIALAELAPLDPTLAAQAGDVPSPAATVDPELARSRLQRAVVDVVIGLSRVRPVAVVLEDLQWADPSSMQLLSLVAHELDQHPVLIVGTYRDQEAGTAVAPALGGLVRLPGTVEIRLSGLDASAVRRFVELTAGRDVDEAVTLSIAGRTSGNPLFVGELTRLLHSERALDPSVVRRAPVPAGVREVIRRRVDRLPAQTVTVLNVAAVLGRRFDLSLLEAVVQLPGDELLEQVESALATGLVAESALVPGSFEFTHDLVRDTLLHDLSGARRGRLHARTAAALVANAASADRARPFEIAHHMLEALPLVPVEDVVPHVIAAADAAASGLAFEEAETGFRRALELVELLPGDARGAHELAIRVRLGRILTITRGHAAEEVGDVIGRAVTLADEREFEADGRQARWAAAVFAGASGDLAAGIELSGKLLAWGQDHSDPAGQCLGHTALGGFHWCRGDLRAAAHHLGAAVDVADAAALDEDPLVAPEIGSGAWARSRHAQLAWLAGRDEEAERLIVDARRRAGGRGKESARVHVECYDAWLGIFRRDLPAARERAERALAAADALHYRQYSSLARVLAAAAADEPATRAVELGRAFAEWESTGNRLYVSFFHALHAEAELEIGNVERAAAILERAEGVVRDAGERFYEPEVHRLLAVLALHLGDSDVAASRLERGLDVVRELGLLAFEERLVAAIDASPR